ncbi:MAG: TrkH family potassium uptake protein [Methanobacteriaceae archaeon]|jgi:trk system potassium uptake protein TrkH|uniref:TrkH family potassium uptake protein n=1 Tax=unclassified Methanobrevibacter TaxID=2638681 RepID=UPI002A0D0774|nr:TrkH family potassium uptake protein [Methanobacteriaceae archaeon]MDD3408492.1 TrkH family potassium uptake protein [Methanobacteriaceae archaeon]MDD4594573.1 TrkH family potassium uptake protein [Methanobacteriaceae archaeon]
MAFIKRKYLIDLETILHYFGEVGIFIGISLFIPIIVALIYGEEAYITPFLYVGIFSIVLSLILKFGFKKRNKMSIKLSMFFVMFIWLYISFLGALPYVLSGELTFVNAFFEAMSGFTTTGFTMFSPTQMIPHCINFWRGFTQWIGGLGIVFMVLSIMQIVGNDVKPLYNAEGRDERIFPSIKHTTKSMLLIYTGITVVGIILFIIAGMPVFDSIFYSFSAISTGGFALSSSSIYQYNSFLIELVAIVLMILGGTNFNLHYVVLKGKWREYFKDIETKIFLVVSVVSILVIGLLLTYHNVYGSNIFHNFRFALFQVISAITTTGLQTSFAPELHGGYTNLGVFILVIIMIIGAGTGSTGGGIKLERVGIMYHSIQNHIKSLLEPSNAVVVNKYHHIKDYRIDDKMMKYTLTFISLYLIIYIISVLIVLLYCNDLSGVLFEIASAMGNVGLGDGLVGPTSPLVVKLVYTFDFWAGRLEIWPVVIVFYNIARKLHKTI